MTEESTRTQYFCPLTKTECRTDCAWFKEGQCIMHTIAYEISLIRGN